MTATPTHAPARKAVLFCRACGHESPIDGDWVVSEPTTAERRRVYECPACEATVLTRPLFEPVPA